MAGWVGVAARLVMLTKTMTSPAYVGARLGADRVAEKWGAMLQHLVAGGADPAGQQGDMLARAIAQHPDAILLHPFANMRINALIGEARDAGIPLALVVNKPPAVRYDAFVGSDDAQLAEDVTSHLCRHLGGSGRVAILHGSADALGAPARARGFRRGLARWPGVTLAAEGNGDYERPPAEAAMNVILSRSGPVDGVLAANDLSALGALAALDAAGQAASVIGINATPEGVRAIKTGRLLASAAFSAMTMACIGVEAVLRRLRGETVPLDIMLPVTLVTAENADPWDKPYADRALPDWHAVVAAGAPA